MPAFDWEIEHALEEGIKLNCSWGPQRIIGSGGKALGIEFIRCTSVFDADGQFRPLFDPSESMFLSAPMIILAIGQVPNVDYLEGSDVAIKGDQTILTDAHTFQTDIPNVFAGGDAVNGPSSAIEALAAGRKAAISIDRFLQGKDLRENREREGTWVSELTVRIEGVPKGKDR